MVSREKETLYFLFRTMETVAWDTPAFFATSEEVAFFLGKKTPPLSFFIGSELYPSFQGTQKSYFVNVLQVSAYRNAAGDPADFDPCRFDNLLRYMAVVPLPG